MQAGVAEGTVDRPTGRLTGREQVRPLLLTVPIVAAAWAGPLWLPGPWDSALTWLLFAVTAVLLWTRGPRVGVDRRTVFLLGIPVLGFVMAITALWRAFSPRPYWREYPGWGRRGWTVAIALSALFAGIGTWGAAYDAGWRARRTRRRSSLGSTRAGLTPTNG